VAFRARRKNGVVKAPARSWNAPRGRLDGRTDAQLAALLARAVAEEKLARATPKHRSPDGRSKHGTFQRWLREHAPLVHFGLYGAGDDLATAAEQRRRRELEELARVRSEALAYCVECRNPLIASEYGLSQFCPYERAGQHEKLRRAIRASTGLRLIAKTRPTAAAAG